jgi:hypothetical protein
MRVEPKKAKQACLRLRRTKILRIPLVLLRNTKDRLLRDSEYRIYSFAPGDMDHTPPTVAVLRDSLPDLLRYTPAEGWQSKQSFLSRSLARLESGEHVYTVSDGERLLHYGWLREHANKTFSTEVQQELPFPEGSAYLYDFYTFPYARGRALYQQSLRRILMDLRSHAEVKRAFIGVLADNGPSRHVIEKVGFTYEFSGFQKIRLGWARRWSEAPLQQDRAT